MGWLGSVWRRSQTEVLAAAMNRPVQMVNGGLYLRGLLEDGSRKSVERVGRAAGRRGGGPGAATVPG